LAEKARIYSLHGVSKDAWKRYDKSFKGHAEVLYPGFKYNMSDVQAAIGLHQLPKLDRFIEQREWIARQYDDAFREVPQISVPGRIPHIKHAHHLYILVLDTGRLDISRDLFMDALKKENIGTGIHFRSLHIQPYYKARFRFKDTSFPNACDLSGRILSLPMYPKMTQYDVDTVIKAVKKLIEYYKK
jgi:dTDP-4-amino-4,6-dideoxygalactose transaminase